MEQASTAMAFTGERYVPGRHGNIELEHLHRYLVACQVVAGKNVLDIASGEGYGSSMLAQSAANMVIGVDISEEAIAHARTKYETNNLNFRVGSCSNIPLADNSIDVVVSFETIEHHDDHQGMMFEVKRVLRPDGVLIISSPDKLEYSDKLDSHNEYHVKELYRDEFKELLRINFKKSRIYGQKIAYGSVILSEEGVSTVASYDLADEDLPIITGVPAALYLVAVASDADLPVLGSGVLEQPINQTELVQSWSGVVAERDAQIAALNHSLIERAEVIISVDKVVAERDKKIAELDNTIIERDTLVARHVQTIDERNEKIEALSQELDDHVLKVESLTQQTAVREDQIVNLVQTVGERDNQIETLTQAMDRLQSEIEDLFQENKLLSHTIDHLRHEIMQISDWAYQIDSSPFRYAVKKNLFQFLKGVHRALPLNPRVKRKLKDSVLSLTRPLRKNSPCQAHHIPLLPNEFAEKKVEQIVLSGKRDIFVFAVIDWHFRIQRPQHLARSFANTGRRVFYFSNHFVDESEPGYQIEQLDSSTALYQIKLHVKGAPAIYFAPPTPEQESMLQLSIAKLILDFDAISTISLVQHPYWYSLVKCLPNTFQIYDCMDHHEGFGNVPEELITIEKKMLREFDLVVVTSCILEEFARTYNENVAVIRNAGEYEFFSEAPVETFVDPLGRKIIGYYGAIAEWFDLDLIRAVAVKNPQILVLLVGNDTINAKNALKDLPNVEFTGEVPYLKLPYYLHAFDLCILPFQVIPLTLATNPVKVYEYLAAGKPVVSVDLPEMAQFDNLVQCASSYDEFVQVVSDYVNKPESKAERRLRQQRQQFAIEQTWHHRVNLLEEVIQYMKFPRISVIVLTFNNLSLTKACLDSLVRWSDYPDLEIITVDNASIDGTPEYLQEFERQHQNVKLLLNEKNLGFAAGNNLGLQAASGDYLVMLNNDTVVTPGWALTLLRYLQTDESIGMIGPVTNNIGNEAKIDIQYDSSAEMLPLAMNYTIKHMGQTIPLRTAAFFCAMMSRKVFEQVGPLDEMFGRGFFEDDDYCRRIELLGLRIVCAEDVFIHHQLSASFDKLKQQERQELFEVNKKIYEAKWGEWSPHIYRGTVK